jgi:predicted DCC family thiol-disulfide oxidoreductase YuxK
MDGTPTNDSHEVLFYDGGCGLCHRVVSFVLHRDREGVFHFAPMDGAYFQTHFPKSEWPTLEKKVVLLSPSGDRRYDTDAILHIMERLTPPWPTLARLARILPEGVRDACFHLVSRMRKRLFAPPPAVCPMMTPEEERRFVLDRVC